MIYTECCIFISNKMTVKDCPSVNSKNIFLNPVLNFALGGQVTYNPVTWSVHFHTEAVTQPADTEQCRQVPGLAHFIKSEKYYKRTLTDALQITYQSSSSRPYNLRSHPISPSEVHCFSLTLLTEVSLHCYSFSTQFFSPCFPYTHLGMAYKKIFVTRLKQKEGENCSDGPSMQSVNFVSCI